MGIEPTSHALQAIEYTGSGRLFRVANSQPSGLLLSKNGASVRSKHSLLPPVSANFGKAIVRKQQIG